MEPFPSLLCHIQQLIHQKNPDIEIMQNVTTSHHLCCYHSGLSYHGILPGLVQRPPNLLKILVRSYHSSVQNPAWIHILPKEH